MSGMHQPVEGGVAPPLLLHPTSLTRPLNAKQWTGIVTYSTEEMWNHAIVFTVANDAETAAENCEESMAGMLHANGWDLEMLSICCIVAFEGHLDPVYDFNDQVRNDVDVDPADEVEEN